MNRIKVNVVDRGDKGFFFRWKDQLGNLCEELARDEEGNPFKKRNQAERAVPGKVKQLKARLAGDGSIPWIEWREALEDYYSSIQESSGDQIDGIINQFEMSIEADTEKLTLADINTPNLSKHATRLRKLGRSENTIASHFRNLSAALSWSVERGFIEQVPKMPRVPRSTKKKSRGRPLTDEEFERMLAVIPDIVEPGAEESWRHFLWGLWLSGLRLSEALNLTWEPSETGIWLEMADRRPKLVVRSEAEKGQQDRLLPLTPDFRQWLKDNKNFSDRTGFVFRPLVRYQRETRSRHQCTNVISRIGEASGVITEPGQNPTAHDFRRSFGLRWAMMVQPPVLQQLMRHESIQTTMTYYAKADADRWGDEIDAAWEDRKQRVNRKVNQKNGNSRKPRKK